MLLFYKIIILHLYVAECRVGAADILVMSYIPSISHFASLSELAKALAKRGHLVDVVSHFPLNECIPGYNDISIKRNDNVLTNSFGFDYLKFIDTTPLANIPAHGLMLCKWAFDTLQLQDLKKSTKKYDLLVTELFASDCMLGWAWHFGIPTILIANSIPLPWASDRFGLPDNPAYIPTYFAGIGADMSLYERIMNTWTLLQGKYLYQIKNIGPSEQLAKDFFGKNLPALNDLAYNTSLLLTNTHFSINDARPLGPNVIEVGGLHIRDPKPLNPHFNHVLNTELEGIILLTFGSLVVVETFPDEILQEIFLAFSQLPFKILFKADKRNVSESLRIPENVHFEEWMPQLDILCDSRVKLFVTHGGMLGLQEAVHCGMPILGIPLFADQLSNVKQAEMLGFGLTIALNGLTKDVLLEGARKLLYEPKYARNAKRVSKDFKDRPMSAKDTAVYWTEYVIRHKGAPKLQSAAKRLSWYQYYMVDVIIVAAVIPCVALFLFRFVAHQFNF